jgi:predicted anti-sigma-YlaC factor YlaD
MRVIGDMARGRPIACERTRALVSAQLDGAGSELERRLVDAHVRGCEECGTFRDEAEAIAGMLRSAPLESFLCQLETPRRGRRRATAQRTLGVAAALVGVFFVGGVLQSVTPPRDTSEAAMVASPLVEQLAGDEAIRPLARESLVQASESPAGPGSKRALPVVN